ncbi:MAG: anthranilate synthase component 1 [Alteromonas sp.]|uniref:anthranilate synthase component 1 n=2 Tax=Alteromonas TaxID=226 RepID=UPI00066AE90E|nr:anthranilate synthase component 1 [Alteromonas macleodii]MAW04212.1 anthranilate synthase component 1 [Alteromonas sp.]NKX30559.1 anthranilate synthase component 1 [Alteromonadaceae bacterium A_SAG1]CAI3946644.1 anthranilate synthase [Alteromonas macleodii]VTP51508.1 anthranilate synthase [Alteromonas macleodii]HAO17852.1 anthranilate synthase component 1 [Alteromonas macleodii]|tara:strand:- start:20740 stop:22488 length:1749 start_codon:yes stop_codon:yes gene_type:complete
MSLAELGISPGKVETIEQVGHYVDDPLAAFAHLCGNKNNALLLESAEIDSKDDLQSLLMVDAALRMECRDNRVEVKALTGNGASVLPLFVEHAPDGLHIKERTDTSITLICDEADGELDEDSRLKAASVMDALRIVINKITPIRQHPHAVFLGGVFAYDMLAGFEKLPDVAEGENDCPDFVFYLAETLITVDHQTRETHLIGSVFSGQDVAQQYFAIAQRLEAIHQQLHDMPAEPVLVGANTAKIADVESEAQSEAQSGQSLVSDSENSNETENGQSLSSFDPSVEVSVDLSDEQFCNHVLDLKQHILAGDIFQVVPSRTFSLPCPSPLLAYAKLKESNPSPYMFYMQDAAFSIFGASPESALKYERESNQVEIYPIAGTRPRGKRPDGSIDRDLDSRIELNLREDTKEKSEHIMLVDLARNDVAKVSRPGTRYVKDLLKVDRYSHVMHLVSRVVGQLRDDLDPLHAYQACMNMGTLVGAPKVSAATLIREVEKKRRGSYGGAVGYLNGQGDMDTCIVIRSAFVKNGTAYIQAGAGVVYDSVPQAEADETRAKAQAVIGAVKAALQEEAESINVALNEGGNA